ncbi:hypothetical protein GCM10029964_126590 [Kibdelosporangium lantanae]
MVDYPDPNLSSVILMGTCDYERADKLHNLPAVRNNLTGLQRILSDSACAVFSPENCVVIDTPDTPKGLLRRLRRAASITEDVLLVYYSGHGILDRNGELYLCVAETDPDPHEVDGTGVPFKSVRQVIEDSPARVRVLILDCCFSGRAIGAMSSESAAMEQIRAEGTYILTSSEAEKVSRSIPGERYTAFTGELIRILSEENAPLTLRQVSIKLTAAMARRNLPRPMSRADSTSAELLLSKPGNPEIIPPQAILHNDAIGNIGSEKDLLAAIDATIEYFNDGDIVKGTVVKVNRDEILVDFGYKTHGVIPSRELSVKHDIDPTEVVAVGDEVEALVLQKEDKKGRLILSKKRAQYERAWSSIEKLKNMDEPVKGRVIDVVKDGLILDIGVRGFLPASLVELRRVRDLQPYVGRELKAKIIELNKDQNKVVLSRSAWLARPRSKVQESLDRLARGQRCKGTVSSVADFGAFVDLGGVDGLVHVSELSWKHFNHPSEVVEVGQEVTVEVLDVNADRESVTLSLKATEEDPWRQFVRTYAVGQIVPGKVTRLVALGAFVRVGEGVEVLVHNDELADWHVEAPEQVVQVNRDVMVKVVAVDEKDHQIFLSLRQANEVDMLDTEFDPIRYGMFAEFDAEGNYIYPEGFDPEAEEWLEGYDQQREEWERQYAEAHRRYTAHREQVELALKAEDMSQG